MESLALALWDANRLPEAEAAYRELVEQRRRGSPTPLALDLTLVGFAGVLLQMEKYAEAEPLLREVLTIREEMLPHDFWRFNVRSVLGGALAGQRKFEEAEPLLIEGYKGLKASPETPTAKACAALERLVKLYEAWDKPDEAAKWRAKVEEFDRQHPPTTQPSTQPADSPR